jgi:hypothetical protein
LGENGSQRAEGGGQTPSAERKKLKSCPVEYASHSTGRGKLKGDRPKMFDQFELETSKKVSDDYLYGNANDSYSYSTGAGRASAEMAEGFRPGNRRPV